jgi:hypothetical protein
MRWILFLVVLGLSEAAIAQGEGPRASEVLLGECVRTVRFMDGDRNDVDTMKIARCTGYVQGYGDALIALGGQSVVCMPDGITVGQMVRIVVKYLQDNPQLLHLDKSRNTLSAFTRTYPCRK